MTDQTQQPLDLSNEQTAAMPRQGGSSLSPTRTATPVELAEGRTLGEFRLVRKLGQGGMASVWLAEQTSLHRNVALKLLSPELMADEAYVKRFQTEAKAAAGLNHPNIVQVYVIGESGGQHFIAQEYVQGSTLKALLQRKGPLDLGLALHIMRQVASALQAAGEQGIVHRDIKPENIMLTRKGEAKVADFGLAQLTLGGERLNLTQEGVAMGTPLYMSPEQVNGKKVDARSDLYSFGVTCYHMLTGQPPFSGDSAISVAVQHLQNSPRPPKEVRPELPGPLNDMVMRLMAKQPDRRYPDAATLLDDIRAMIRALRESGRVDQIRLSEPVSTLSAKPTFASRRPVLTLALLCLLTAGASAAAGWWIRAQDPRDTPPAQGLGVPKADSARMQFLQAMLSSDEDAFRAVIHFWDADTSADEWVARAREQLALMYLQKGRFDDARTELQQLRSVGGSVQNEFETKAQLGMALLHAMQGDKEAARAALNQARPQGEQYGLLPGPGRQQDSAWSRLLRDYRNELGLRSPGRPPD